MDKRLDTVRGSGKTRAWLTKIFKPKKVKHVSDTNAFKNVVDTVKEAGYVIWHGETKVEKNDREKNEKIMWNNIVDYSFYGVAGAFLIGSALVLIRRF
jgi:hypothetical protein